MFNYRDPVRMQQAINAVIDSPQNNLRIFRNGNQMMLENDSRSQFNQFAREIFPNDNEATNNLIDFLISVLLCDSETNGRNVLKRILDLQILVQVC